MCWEGWNVQEISRLEPYGLGGTKGMNPRDYLSRIEIEAAEQPSYRFLEKLQYHHLLNVPFENLDIIAGKKIILDEKLIYEKVVVRNRGGFCYELNGLFCWLLNRLGIESRMPAEVMFLDHFYQTQSLSADKLERSSFKDPFPEATKSCSLTISTPVIISVTGCSTCTRVFISMK